MSDFIIRKAKITDIPFLVEAIVEAEKAGTAIFSYSTVFGISEEEAKKYIAAMLDEEIDGFEISISSFYIAEKDGVPAGATSIWVEGSEGLPSSVLKGNLLNYVMPKECIEKAMSISEMVREIDIEYKSNTIQVGASYVASDFRGNRLLSIMTKEVIESISKGNPEISEAFVQIFDCNVPSIKSYSRSGFEILKEKAAFSERIKDYFPSGKKILMKKNIYI